MSDDDLERRAWAYLSRVVEPPCPRLTALVADRGPVETADMIRRGQEDKELTGSVAARREVDCAARDLEILDRRGGRLITPDDDEWPYLSFVAFGNKEVRARPSGYPPMVLWALGPARLDDIAERAAAIVGTRACTSYGEHVAAEITAGLVERDAAVVSGGAYGIDGAAHRAALASDGVTMAVLAGGVDVPYPSGHSALLHRVATSGLLLSEYPPGERPTRYRFLTRNRLAAALSGATVVVEAGLRSGAANTAAWATAMGRKVCAVPGPVTSAASAGCHVLIRNDAVLVDRAEQVVELIGRIGELAGEPDHPETPLDGLTPDQLQVYEALPARGFRSLEQISVGAALPPERVLGPLALLEISGLVEKQDGQWRIRRAG
ncbi:DNA-processing protein DprA [Mycobacterium sp. SMC-18]|uniref:DNA-processing protein DprA n=1 Tax=Mycobacteriaceae TaxID=1762 RepID=UPI001BB2FAEF|nr:MULTISPECIES: DNA-processing protein DprA [unclassified Mycolicibacterium]BCI82184.1 putative DNA processing protein DprA [Mycolicibacterium sp. TY66]BCJ80171.1 putative DNA processing protein DprA [Mycolicibacterium sp. TY81]